MSARLPFVIILEDPDGADWSPWPVEAPDLAAAIEQAREDWRRWCDAGPDVRPDVIKAYPGTVGYRLDLPEGVNS